MSTRSASHAGSWYTSNPWKLSQELDEYLARVPPSIDDLQLPIPGARVIIGPHAGYTYSGPAAAWAYKSLDLSNAKRIFLLGPSHQWGLPGCALTKQDKYETPLGHLMIDKKTVEELTATQKFVTMSTARDENEHSMEMHLPYIYKMLSLHFKSEAEYPPLIPILVGGTTTHAEKTYGEILAPYLADPTSVFIVSSDFCHWGLRFQYTYYLPASPSSVATTTGGYSLRKNDSNPTSPPIYESIARLDKLSMDAVEGGKHDAFTENIDQTGNTVCGRHPIGVIMASIEFLKKQGKIDEHKAKFKFVRYERNEDVEDIRGSSVSYASAYAIM
ncbi:Mediator of 2-driven cell motility 1 [Hyphodiscus hymeniophilus]|uniref:Mediator of 2-driven cell motility 1 n=1 Tax=Hyphodiscus hymeniophilus TaxID=353542 RepID=A0A9P6SN18_9HELO|nr:Mediator of 2-driven cell motility 1 [Hyphodiscus hymeniophilus]